MKYHRYYTHNTGLEAPLRGLAFLVVPEVIKNRQVHCVATLVASLFIKDRKLTDFPYTENKAS